MIPFNPRPPCAAYWRSNTGHWMPTHRRVTAPRRWLRYPLATILLASALWFAGPLAWGEATPAIGWLGPCHARDAMVALPVFAATEGERDD